MHGSCSIPGTGQHLAAWTPSTAKERLPSHSLACLPAHIEVRAVSVQVLALKATANAQRPAHLTGAMAGAAVATELYPELQLAPARGAVQLRQGLMHRVRDEFGKGSDLGVLMQT